MATFSTHTCMPFTLLREIGHVFDTGHESSYPNQFQTGHATVVGGMSLQLGTNLVKVNRPEV